MDIELFIENFNKKFEDKDRFPWEILESIQITISEKIEKLKEDFFIENGIAIHKTAVIENNVILKAPIIIEKNCFVGANSCLRGGVYLSENVKIGLGCEIKSSVIFDHTAIAHFNFIGDSIIGKNVNFEAGSITANHYNE